MKKVILYLVFLGSMLALAPSLKGQDEQPFKKWGVQLNLQHQDMAIGFYVGQLRVAYPVYIRPYYSVEGYRFFKTKKPSKQRFISIKSGLYRNLYHDRWVSAQIGLGVQRDIGINFFWAYRFDFGFASSKNSDIQYELQDGKWEPIPNEAPSSTNRLLGLGLDLGYRLKKSEPNIDLIFKSHVNGHYNSVFEATLPYYGLGLGARITL